jgi:hypothetical protein
LISKIIAAAVVCLASHSKKANNLCFAYALAHDDEKRC